MPAQLSQDGLTIVCTISDGRHRRYSIVGVAPGPLARDLLAALAGMIHPHGTVDAPATANGYMHGLRDLCAFAAARGVRGGVTVLTRGLLAEYWMQAGWHHELTTRRMLTGFDAAGGILAVPVRELAAGRFFSSAPSSSPLVPYTAAEWDTLHRVCRQSVDESFNGHRQMREAAQGGQDPFTAGWVRPNMAWLLAAHGPRTAGQIGEAIARPAWWVQRNAGVQPVCNALFPDVGVVIAYRLLLGIYSGIVPDGIADLGVGDIDWAGDATVLLSYVKGRTAPESMTVPRKAVRLLEQWLNHSALARRHAPAEMRGHLWLHHYYFASPQASPGEWWKISVDNGTQRKWAARTGAPVISRRRIRTTYLSLRDRRNWHGSPRALIDPNHSPAVEGDNYLTAATPAQADAVETIITEAQHDMLRRAEPPTVLSGQRTAELAAGFPHVLARIGAGHDIAGVLAGEQDVFVAACADPASGLHGPAGKPCPARPWVCLLCPLAIFTPRHVPNLLALKAFFARQWQQLAAPQFMAVFGPYAIRIDEVLSRYPARLVTAADTVAGDDDQLPLRPEERTA
jgi:hypothetical protein